MKFENEELNLGFVEQRKQLKRKEGNLEIECFNVGN